MDHGSRGSWVTWVMSHGSRGSWVTWVIGHVGRGLVHWWVRWVTGHKTWSIDSSALGAFYSHVRSDVQGRQWTSAWQWWSCWFYWFCWALLMKLRVAARRLEWRWVRATAACCVRSTEPHRRYQSVIYGLQRRICHRKPPVLDTVPYRHLVTASTTTQTSAPVSSTTALQLNANRCQTASTSRYTEKKSNYT